MKKIIWVVLLLFISLSCFGEMVEDSIEVRIDVEPYFSLTVETYMIPFVEAESVDLLVPSKNIIENEKNLEGEIRLGHLIARKQGDEILPLISEYRVLMRVSCETNRNQQYQLTQKLEEPLTGIESNKIFPEKAFVCMAAIDSDDGDISNGKTYIQWESPIIASEEMLIYESALSGYNNLSNIINIVYWVSDQQEDKVTYEQQADKYTGIILLTMLEL